MFLRKRISRRNLLGKIGQLLATASGLSLSRDIALARTQTDRLQSNRKPDSPSSRTYTIAPWTGDDFTLGHQLRHKKLPKFPDVPDEKVDFVIVGGGIAGLTAALYMDNENYLLLEQYDELGGQSRGDSWKGLGFSYGSTIISHPQDAVAEVLGKLDLKPIQLNESSTDWIYESQQINGTSLKHGKFQADFASFKRDAKPIWQASGNGNVFSPLTDHQLLKLDELLFSSCLGTYSSEFVDLLNCYLRSYLGAGAESVSALAGFAVLRSLVEPNYTLSGGNVSLVNLLSRKLHDRGDARIRTKTFVWSIELSDNGSMVSYTDKNGICHKVQCRHVIVATPHLVSARILTNLNDAARLPLFGYRYCSYLVANLLLKKSILKDGYAHFTAKPFSFSEIITSETPYKLKGHYNESMGAALTVLQPYEPASNGRALLLAGDKESFASEIIKQVQQINDQLETNLERVILTRWGHALAVPGPNYFSKLNNLQKHTGQIYSLAHSSAKGLPRIESAVIAARQAAYSALTIKDKSKTYSIQKSR